LLEGQLQNEFPFPIEPLTNFIVPIYEENPLAVALPLFQQVVVLGHLSLAMPIKYVLLTGTTST